MSSLAADKTRLEKRVTELSAQLESTETVKVAAQTEVAKLQSALSIANVDKQGLEAQRESLQWQLKQSEEAQQVRCRIATVIVAQAC
jgi:hypothetical protein